MKFEAFSQAYHAKLSRRAALAALAAAGMPLPTWGSTVQAEGFWEQPRSIRLKHLYGGEKLEITFWRDGQDIPSAYEEIAHYFRDRKARRYYTRMPSPRLLDGLYAYDAWLNSFGIREHTRFHHGARDPLRRTEIEGAVRDSAHERAEASDISHERVSPLKMSQFGIWLGIGGVGWYPTKHFTHIEAAHKLRVWRGK